jgi:hypothetical protein
MSLVLNVEILGEFRNLTKATQGSQSELSKLNKKITGFSSSAKKAFASIGVGLSFAFIARELGDATKAAVEDAKAQALLAKQLETTTGANKDQIKSVENSITKWQTQFGVLDDELRPAYATLIRSTGDVTSANKLMAIALDASAATGKSLESVTLAMGKSFNGSDTALIKLMPSLKGSKDAINDLAAATKGAAETAANNDPYLRMTAIFASLQEKVGMALLPALGKLSSWLASPGGTEALTIISDALVRILTDAIAMAKWAVANKDWLLPLVTGIGAIVATWKAATTAVTLYNTAAAIAAGLGAVGGKGGAVAGKTGKVPALLPALGVAGAVGAVLTLSGDSAQGKKAPLTPTSKTAPSWTGGTNLLAPQKTASGITINVNQAVTAKTIVDTVSAYSKSTGTSLSSLLR